jgi:hypothetical protein
MPPKTKTPAEKTKEETIEQEQSGEEVQPDPTRHVFLGDTMLDIAKLGTDNPRERRILYAGNNYEHVSEHESGCWIYRRM